MDVEISAQHLHAGAAAATLDGGAEPGGIPPSFAVLVLIQITTCFTAVDQTSLQQRFR